MNELYWTLTCVVAAVTWGEGREWLPSMSKWLIHRAVAYLPEHERERMLEELLAEVAVIPGKISPAVFAGSLWWSLARGSLTAQTNARLSPSLVRLCDITFVTVLSLCVWPWYAILFCTRLARGEEIFHRERRIGMDGAFDLLTFKVDRSTAVGYLISMLGLDRIPMLSNVGRGDLSFVGPAALNPDEAAGHKPTIRPGIIWKDGCPDERWHEFGRSIVSTARLYFRAGGRGLWYFMTRCNDPEGVLRIKD
jgi:hypothetical protein